ncbi:hypothetical protein Syun_002076 [Stephania yunnanensis]|uniref:Uncharacterized protein n=1 Tax=Stephania yunnanensis TaxID=152371 RepID=A0AAP0LF86_9MAGN
MQLDKLLYVPFHYTSTNSCLKIFFVMHLVWSVNSEILIVLRSEQHYKKALSGLKTLEEDLIAGDDMNDIVPLL